ncbi:hypothetical protein OIU84_021678 [Salix udensis]|uniref:Uncharacterized protein n=1 Tax=Salix udensis TaxID=889485 RepID=A0AAD6KVQ6_9ROSI|nr:hypothetical protein OIU84_021678 [Salix udensis]
MEGHHQHLILVQLAVNSLPLHHVRPSPPPSKASTSAPRSSTPRRMSTGSGARGTSPVRTSRGNSASPKIRAWQSNIPGLSSEAPPNLRTSLADRPASYVRGSSPASKNSKDSCSKFSRRSVSPASRSVSSSHGHDRDRISSQSKGSVASSGDDDVDSLQSIHVGSLDRLALKRSGGFPNNRAPAFSKNSSRVFSPSSAPKRSFDSAIRQMDHRKSPQNMFRPLLSSVPSTTLYSGKASSEHSSLMLRNSSVTTSINASSDQVTCAAPDTEGSCRHQDDMATETWQDDSLHSRLHDFGRDTTIEHEPGDSEEFRHHDIEISSASDTLCVKADFSEVDSLESTKVCCKCGCRYHVIETLEKDVDFCPDCCREENLVGADCCREENLVGAAIPDTLIVADESLPVPSIKISKEYKQSDEPDTPGMKTELSKVRLHTMGKRDFIPKKVLLPCLRWREVNIVPPQAIVKQDSHLLKVLAFLYYSKRSISSKGPVVQGRTLVASSITYDDLSYARDCANSLRSSIGYGSTSASSSIDFSSGRHSETRVQRQLSGRKSDLENHRYDLNSRPQSTSSSFSGTLSDGHQTLGLATNTNEENVDVSEVSEEDLFTQNDSNRKTDISSSDMPHHTVGIHLEENSVVSYENRENISNNAGDVSGALPSAIPLEHSVEGRHNMLNTSLDKLDVTTHSRLASISEIEVESNCCGTGSENDDISTNSRSTINEVQDHPVPAPSDKETTASVLEHNMPDHADGILVCSKHFMLNGLFSGENTSHVLQMPSKRESSEPMEGSRPTVTILGKSAADRKDPRGRPAGKRASKSQKVRQRRAETDAKHSANKTENDENRNESMVRNVGLPSEMDSMKPPKLESKCNCTVM